MLLHQSTWHEVEDHLSRSRGLIIPIGSTEQHGPNGLIGTDSICPEAIAQGISEQFDALVGPTITLGVAQFNLGFPGSVSVRPTTLIALIEDYVRSLVRSGFDHFYFLNGHGGNLATARAAFQEIYTEASLREAVDDNPVRCRIRSWWELPKTNALRHELFGELGRRTRHAERGGDHPACLSRGDQAPRHGRASGHFPGIPPRSPQRRPLRRPPSSRAVSGRPHWIRSLPRHTRCRQTLNRLCRRGDE